MKIRPDELLKLLEGQKSVTLPPRRFEVWVNGILEASVDVPEIKRPAFSRGSGPDDVLPLAGFAGRSFSMADRIEIRVIR